MYTNKKQVKRRHHDESSLFEIVFNFNKMLCLGFLQ